MRRQTPLSVPLQPGGAVLSNGRFWSFVSRRGTGSAFFQFDEQWIQTYGWRPDLPQDHLGWLVYLRDRQSGAVWSATPAPRPHPEARYHFQRHAGVAAFACQTPPWQTQLEVWVDGARPQEHRRLRIKNLSSQARAIEVTTYLEVVLFPLAAFVAHPAFAKLFVQTEWCPAHQCLLARRRPRSGAERWPLLFLAAVNGEVAEYETDRLRFIGRGHTPEAPRALTEKTPLSCTAGNVLDPIFSLRHVVELAPGEEGSLDYVCGLTEEEARLPEVLGGGEPPAARQRRKDAEECHRELMRGADLQLQEAKRAEALAVALLYRSPELRSAVALPGRELAQEVRTKVGVRDGRMVFVAVGEEEWWERVGRYWQHAGLPIDVWVARPGLEQTLVRPANDPQRGATLSADEFAAFLAIADGYWSGEARRRWQRPGRRVIPQVQASGESASGEGEISGLELWNGFGGFRDGGQEYVVPVGERFGPPLPWVNVIANPEFGCLVSERGAGFTWSCNSREFRLTAWSNDPVTDPPSECLYLRDEDTGAFCSLFPAPCGPGRFEVTHGQGFSRWRTLWAGVESTVTCFVPPDESLRVWWIELVNHTAERKRLSLWAYHQLVLGADPWTQRSTVRTELDSDTPILWAYNPAIELFERRAVFAALVSDRAWRRQVAAGDRLWFLGAGGSLAAPEALQQRTWRNSVVGAGLDPAAVLGGKLWLAPGERWHGAALLGATDDMAQARRCVQEYRSDEHVGRRFAATVQFWDERLSELRVETPWPDLDLLVNRWLLYQATSCRLWGRSAFYQSGGAFGYRDQLQDACALLWSHPEETRAQILLHAAHQFPEGDVLHWWHPPWEKGTRTRFSDDLLWLPLVTSWYIDFTGDVGIWDERRPFVQARSLTSEEEEAYLAVTRSTETATLYEHCCRAIDRSLTRGPHGLPLMGTGDWNDGMNRVGRQGKGESVWLGFFLAEILARFAPVCEDRGDEARAQRYWQYRRGLVEALAAHGWDGAWYRRAYFDDGTPLGSAQNSECQIDALVQAWAVLSGVASPHRAMQALAAVEERLVDREAKIIRLLAPPFDRMPRDPGYIKGYLPGIRENGGQYTHAAVWVVQAFLHAGLLERASELLRYLLPTEHARDAGQVCRYMVEPYVVAADIYGEDPHRGRGGWTWYTGSAGWLYRLIVETFLGVRLERGRTLVVEPRVPAAWPGFRVRWRVPLTGELYHIEVENRAELAASPLRAWLDGAALEVNGEAVRVQLKSDAAEHDLKIVRTVESPGERERPK